MGLGKTFQVSAFLAGALCGGSLTRALIVAPTTLIAQWVRELEACGLGKETRVLGAAGGRGAALAAARRGGVLLTSYGMVLHNAALLGGRDGEGEAEAEAEEEEGEGVLRWDWLICDEGHKLKNPAMQLVARLASLPARRRLLLTGTPVQNNLGECVPLLAYPS